MLRLHPPLLTHLDEWISERGLSSRPEAIRQLLEIALAAGKAKRPSPEAAHKASKLAAKTAEDLLDSAVPEEEQQRRKRRLIHGPTEFRDIRKDQPKKQS